MKTKKKNNNTIIAGQFPSSNRIVSSPIRELEGEMYFSFKYIDKQSPIFTLNDGKMSYVFLCIERLRIYSGMKVKELLADTNNKSTRFHPINWSDTAYKNGFPIKNKELWENKSYQLELGKNFGRIHGFLINDTFYLVWIDPLHRLYPGK